MAGSSAAWLYVWGMRPLTAVAVITGNGLAFTRLLDMVAAVAREHPTYRFWVQHGAATLPPGLEGAPFVSHEVVLAKLMQADAVVCHAGSGTIGDALANGHHPILVPRRSPLREIVNDHQLDLCRALTSEGRAMVVQDAAELAHALATVVARGRRPPDRTNVNKLVQSVREAVSELLVAPHSRTRWRSALARAVTMPLRGTLLRPL